jgi:hypothetical protein
LQKHDIWQGFAALIANNYPARRSVNLALDANRSVFHYDSDYIGTSLVKIKAPAFIIIFVLNVQSRALLLTRHRQRAYAEPYAFILRRARDTEKIFMNSQSQCLSPISVAVKSNSIWSYGHTLQSLNLALDAGRTSPDYDLWKLKLRFKYYI